MSKFNKRLLIILTASLLTLSIVTITYSFKIKNYKNELYTLNEELLVKDSHLPALRDQLSSNENEYLLVQDKLIEYASVIHELSKENESLSGGVKAKQELIQEYRNDIEELTKKLEQMESRVSTNLIYDHFSIDFSLTEPKAIELFGKPLEDVIEIYGSDVIWYLEGLYSKESIYEKFTLYYQGDTEGENYGLIGYSTNSLDLHMTKDVRVGDSLETLLDVYPIVKEDTWNTEGKGFFYQDMYSMTAVYFEIENEKISKITISTIID